MVCETIERGRVLSQVIVTNDEFKSQREKSRQQERQISCEDDFARWRRNDITGKDHVLSLVGFAVLPIVVLWALLGVVMVAALELANLLFKLLGRVIGGTKSLITGR